MTFSAEGTVPQHAPPVTFSFDLTRVRANDSARSRPADRPLRRRLPLSYILAGLPLAEDVKGALLGEENQTQAVYELVTAYERGAWRRVAELAAEVSGRSSAGRGSRGAGRRTSRR